MTYPAWPILRHYDADHLDRISLPLGGIGTGTVGLGGHGELRDFELGNRPAKGFRPDVALFVVRAEPEGRPAQMLAVEGPVPLAGYEGAFGSPTSHHGLPRFRDCRFEAAYPLGQVQLSDDAFPLEITMQGFNPFVLTDVESSSIPVAVLRHRLRNHTGVAVRATVALAMSNFIGANGTEDNTGGNENLHRVVDGVTGITFRAAGIPSRGEASGEFTMALLTPDGVDVSHRTGWDDRSWGNPLLDFWDDLFEDGRLEERQTHAIRPVGSLAGEIIVPANGTADLTFLLTWCFPNRKAWRSEEYGGIDVGQYVDDIVGNAYALAYPDSWQTCLDLVNRLGPLEIATIESVRAVTESDAPAAIREAALFNLSTLRSPTVFQTADGEFYGWEGVGDREGSCYGTCTHVWGYEFATSMLFAPIARSFRRTQYARSTDERGLMSFRAGLPAEHFSRSWTLAAADGQMACLVHLYLDWRLSGDDAFLTELWPAARRTLAFCWIPGGWDADQDGVMEGVQHNTMDVEYYGPNPQMGSWYLAALRAGEELAAACGDSIFAEKCRSLFDTGSGWIDQNLFNGAYYRHEIRAVTSPDLIAKGLRHHSMGTVDTVHPDLQLADGCLIDQLVGEYASRLVGLGSLLDSGHVRQALVSVHDRNLRHGFTDHFNQMRSFVLGDETGVLMCTYDEGKRPARPFPYFTEVMTGFEYTAATGLLQVGADEEAVEIISAVRERYDGRRRNPFDEAECGHHYARAMASWSAFATWNDISYDGVTRTLTIGDRVRSGAAFWSTGSAFGTWRPDQGGMSAGTLSVIRGELPLAVLDLGGTGYQPPVEVLAADSPWVVPSPAARP